MATPLIIEEETGTSRGLYHPHNGYYAGAISRMPRPGTTFPAADTTTSYYALDGSRRTH